MSNFYVAEKSQLQIRDYQINFQPADYQLDVSGRVNIAGNFALPANSFYLNLSLPNQTAKQILLNIDEHDHCEPSNNINPPCHVYLFHAPIYLVSDHYFQTPIINQNIPLKIQFGFNNQPIKGLDQHNFSDLGINQLVQDLALKEIKTSFVFNNEYDLQAENALNYQKLAIVTGWTIQQNHPITYHKSELGVHFNHLTHLINQPITNLFQLTNFSQQKLSVINLKSVVDYYLTNNQQHETTTIDFHHHQVSYDLDHNLTVKWQLQTTPDFINHTLSVGDSGLIQGWFLPYQAHGSITSEALIKFDQMRLIFKFTNPFSFMKNYLYDHDSELNWQVISQFADWTQTNVPTKTLTFTYAD